MKPTPPVFPAAAPVKFLPKPLGLYLHIPFCRKKCSYCDFYAACVTETRVEEYLQALLRECNRWGGLIDRPIDTVYLGGGTPSVLGKRIVPLLTAVRQCFAVSPDAEITAEVNPGGEAIAFLPFAVQAGVNRLSVGMQSADEAELKMLGRTHTAADVAQTLAAARALGLCNISLDLMAALPDSRVETLQKSLDFALRFSVPHLSVYLLKIEPKTKLFAAREQLALPDEAGVCAQYLYLCDRLRKEGYDHYEISNFAQPGFESKHNLKYWQAEEYLGIGPAAHSFLNGRRFYYPRDLAAFCRNPATAADGSGGDLTERVMLGLRLKRGVDFSAQAAVHPLLRRLEKAGLGLFRNGSFSLTDRGMLVSNAIICEITEGLV